MNSKSKRRKIALVIILAVLLVLILAVSVTAAYLTSRRNAEGYLNFAAGLSIQYENVEDKGNAQEFGNLLYLVDGDSDGEIDDGELKPLTLSDIQPGKSIRIANPKLTPKEGTATFALRAKLVLTDMSDPQNPVEYVKKADIEEFLNGTKPLLLRGGLNFAEGWEYNESDNYYYFTTAGTDPILDRLIEVGYNSQSATQQEIYLFQGDMANEELTTITIIDGQPLEEIPVKSLKIELFIEAIEYLSISYWA